MPSFPSNRLEDDAFDDKVRHMTNVNVVDGNELASFMEGSLRVVESTTTAGRLVAVKSACRGWIDRAEADMSKGSTNPDNQFIFPHSAASVDRAAFIPTVIHGPDRHL